MLDSQQLIARTLLSVQAVGINTAHPVTFKSGIVSPVYVDNRKLPFWPEQWRIIISAFEETITAGFIACEVIAGIEAAGIPHSAALAYSTRRPSVFVRKEAKGHGLKNRVEGGDVAGKSVVLIEDLVTTGGSSLSAIQAIRDAGGIVERCLAIVSYGLQEAGDAFAAAAVNLTTLTTFEIILQEAIKTGSYTEAEIHQAQDWLRDPHGWVLRYRNG